MVLSLCSREGIVVLPVRELEFPRERTGVSPLGNSVWPNDGMDGVCMRSFIVRFVFVSDTACPYVRFVFSPFRFCSSLRSLLREASD